MRAPHRSFAGQLIRLCFLLVAAFALSLLVAGATALWSPLRSSFSTEMLTRYVRPTGLETVFNHPDGRLVLADLPKRIQNDWLGPVGLDPMVFSTAVRASGRGVQVTEWKRNDSNLVHTIAHAGWPYPALRCEGSFTIGPIPAPRGSPLVRTINPPNWIDAVSPPPWLRARTSIRPAIPRPLPYHPITRGLVANTAIYAAALWLLVRARWLLPLRPSRRRLMCPHCSYDLRGVPPLSPCPECGSPIPNEFRV